MKAITSTNDFPVTDATRGPARFSTRVILPSAPRLKGSHIGSVSPVGQFVSAIFLLLMAVLVTRSYHHVQLTASSFEKRTDIKAQYEDAVRLTEGYNPYSRIHDQDLSQNRLTYYFPGFLIASAATIKAYGSDYATWMNGWRKASAVIHFSVGLLLFFMLLEYGSLVGAMVGSGFWFMGRWPLALFKSGQIDAPAIFFLLLALYYLPRKPRTSCFCFGASLAVKQMGAFLFPLYLIWAWHGRGDSPFSGKKGRMQRLTTTVLWCAVVPLVLSAPFIVWDFSSFWDMFWFPLTRNPIGPRPIQSFAGLDGLLAKLPMIGMLLGCYWLAAKQQVSKLAQVALVMVVILTFSGVFFSRHVNWMLPLLPLVVMESAVRRSL